MLAKDIMTKDVITIKPDTSVEKAAKLLIDQKISGMPVVDAEQRVIGIISEGDFIFQQKRVNPPAFLNLFDGILQIGRQRFFDELKKMAANTVEDLMTKEVSTVNPETEIAEIATLMIDKNINRLPVVDEKGKILGIITRHDIIKNMY